LSLKNILGDKKNLERKEINEWWERPLLQFVLKEKASERKTNVQLYIRNY